MRALLAALLLVAGAAVQAGDPPRAGLYRVEVTLEIPNVRGEQPFRTVERCLAADEARGRFLAILASPTIAACPEVRRTGDGRRFAVEVVCQPVNTGRALAVYDLAESGYVGRIAVTMGGKNMTLTEVQRARRVGDCSPP